MMCELKLNSFRPPLPTCSRLHRQGGAVRMGAQEGGVRRGNGAESVRHLEHEMQQLLGPMEVGER